MTMKQIEQERDRLAEECPKGECRNYYAEGFNAAMELMEQHRVKPLVEAVKLFRGYCTEEFAPYPIKFSENLLAKIER